MKSKLLIFIIIVAVMISVFVPAVASSVVDITRPEGNEIVTKDIFSICGVCVSDETTIAFQYKNRETGDYEPLLTTDDESSFKVGNNKIFGKDIRLKYKGENQIRVIAYTKATQSKPQVSDYTITLVDENNEKKKTNWIDAAIKWLTGDKNETEK
jgi:opacity protein-like surface antigen